MKDYLFLYVFVLSFFFSNTIVISNVKIVHILTPKVASNGLLYLVTTGLSIALKKEDNININQFKLMVQNLKTNTQTPLSCFLYQFEDQKSFKIGCLTKGLTPGNYIISPVGVLVTVVTEEPLRTRLRIDPSTVSGTPFEVTEGSEIYFYDYGKKDEDFEYPGHIEDIEFSLFEPASGYQTIYFNNIPIECYAVNLKLTCNMFTSMFAKDKKVQIYNVYIKDSLGNKKPNYFIYSVNITLNYL